MADDARTEARRHLTQAMLPLVETIPDTLAGVAEGFAEQLADAVLERFDPAWRAGHYWDAVDRRNVSQRQLLLRGPTETEDPAVQVVLAASVDPVTEESTDA